MDLHVKKNKRYLLYRPAFFYQEFVEVYFVR